MGLLIGALLVAAVGAVGVFGVMLGVQSKQEFAEQNAIVPGRPSPAPARWAGSQSREARLHRRLVDAVSGARENPRFVELGLAAQMQAIETEALAIDERLVAAASLPESHRQAAIDPLEQHVIDLEAAIADMVTGVTVADSRAQLEAAVSAADIKLQALAEARAEVEQIDRSATGGAAPSPQATTAPPPPPPPPPRATPDTN